MKKQYLFMVIICIILAATFSCVSDAAQEPAPEEFVPVQVPAVEPDAGTQVPETETAPEMAPESEPEAVPEEEVFTEAGFVADLQEILATGSVEDALALYDNLPVENEASFELNYLQASLLISNGDYAAAGTVADRLLEAQPDNTDALVLKAVVAKATGNSAEKQRVIAEILALDPDNSDANTEIGNEYMLKKNFRLARESYLKAYIADSTNIEALAGYGKASYYTNNLADAEKAFQEIIDRYPENAFAWAYLGKLYAESDRYLKALDCAEHAVAYEPDYFDYWIDLGEYLDALERREEAVSAFTTAIELRPDYFVGYIYRGGIYDKDGDFENAKTDYMKAVQLKPEYYFLYESLGLLAFHDKEFDVAREWFTKAYEAYPTNNSYAMLIALCYYRAGQNRAGKDYIYKTVLKKFATSSTEYAVMRLFYDNVADGTVATKVQNETDANKRGQMLFYLAEYYQIKGKDNLAQKYYIAVQEMEAPLFIESRLNDWEVEELMGN